mmetsp:Transcript_10127/g.11598  ORF Transcript_10127/g.11598 Transcript_10127/m.11598 type:complete len:232 (-) Transcript_10127:86-781(-)
MKFSTMFATNWILVILLHSNAFAFTSPSNYYFHRLARHTQTKQRSSLPASQTTNDDNISISQNSAVLERLDLTEQIDRWLYLQDLLEGDAKGEDTNEILFSVINSFLDYPPPRKFTDEEGENIILEDSHVETMENLVSIDGCSIQALKDPDCKAGELIVVNALEGLLPGEFENNDAYKSLWDMMEQLHGREAVGQSKASDGPNWDARCVVARVLIYFDFLQDGILEKPQYQ